MHRVRPVRRLHSMRRLCFCLSPLVLLCVPILAAGQDVAEAARQEKARKAASNKEKSHVYTNEDLKRSQILTREDHDRIAARKKEQDVSPSSQPADAFDGAAAKSSESLGEAARRHRQEKTARQAEQARKTPPKASFPMDISQPALATLAPPRAPGVSATAPPSPASKAAHPPAVLTVPGRRDPFSHPTRISPATPSPGSTISTPLVRAAPLQPQPNLATSLSVQPNSPQPGALTRVGQITVQPGDSLWKLARRHLGKGARWREWLAVNPRLDNPDQLLPGGILLLPPAAVPLASAPPYDVSVRRGESLWKIAQARLGSGVYWRCLAEANPQLRDADHIYPGETIRVPSTCQEAPGHYRSRFP